MTCWLKVSPSCSCPTAARPNPHTASKQVTMGWGGKGKGFGGDSWGGGKSKGWGFDSWSSPMQSWGKSSGKGFGKDKGKGKGKGKFRSPPENKVWVGGLPASESTEDATYKDLNKALQQHFMQAGTCKNVMIGKSGSGAAAMSSPEEAANAIATLNGSTFQGHILEVDTWTKKDGSGFE